MTTLETTNTTGRNILLQGTATPTPDQLIETVHYISRHRYDITELELTPAHQAWLARGWQRNKQLVRSLRDRGRHERADRVDFCQHPCNHLDGTPYIYSCHQPLCFFCTYQRQRRLTERWSLAALYIENPFFLTMPLRDFRHLSGIPHRLAGYFQRLRRRQHFQKHCTGGFYCIECSYSPTSDRFHPHIHALIDAQGLSRSWLSRAWKDLTTAYVVDLRAVPRNQIKSKLLYMLKGPGNSLEPRAVSEIYSSLGSAPLFRAWGSVTRRHGLCRACRDKSQIGFDETCGHARHWE